MSHLFSGSFVVTKFQIEKNKVVLHLKKAVARSWTAELDQHGLETDRPEDNAEEVED